MRQNNPASTDLNSKSASLHNVEVGHHTEEERHYSKEGLSSPYSPLILSDTDFRAGCQGVSVSLGTLVCPTLPPLPAPPLCYIIRPFTKNVTGPVNTFMVTEAG